MRRAFLVQALSIVPTVLGVFLLVFLSIHLIPGDPVAAILGDSAAPGQAEEVRENLGLNEPLPKQFVDFVSDYARGDMGRSLISRLPVRTEIGNNFGYTAALAGAAIAMSALIGVPLGILAAVRRGSFSDRLVQIVTTAGIALPSFWIALLLILVFAKHLGWFPSVSVDSSGGVIPAVRSLVLPTVALALPGIALVSRMTRSSMLDVLSDDYVRTAQAKGASLNRRLYKHSLINAAPPILTVLGLTLGHLLGGAIVIEVVFARPGIGKLLLDSILARDYPLVQGICFIIALLFVSTNFLTDMANIAIDPRQRVQ